MCDLFRCLGNSLDLVEVLSTFDLELRRLLGYDAIAVHVVDNGRLVPAYAAGSGLENLLAYTDDIDALLGVAVERQPLIDGRALVFPLENPTAVIALLTLYRYGAPCFNAQDLDLLDMLSVKLTAAIENALRFQAAAESATLDPVTGLANGRSLFERLDAELARARRAGTRLAVLQCSIEGFAEGNRLCSAESARYALKKIATRIRESCREYDFSARIDNDLMLVLPGLGPSELAEKRALIQRVVEDAALTVGLPLCATVSAAFYPEDGRDTEDLLAESSRMLNLAKRIHAGGGHFDGHS